MIMSKEFPCICPVITSCPHSTQCSKGRGPRALQEMEANGQETVEVYPMEVCRKAKSKTLLKGMYQKRVFNIHWIST
jgi:hypothetical protein